MGSQLPNTSPLEPASPRWRAELYLAGSGAVGTLCVHIGVQAVWLELPESQVRMLQVLAMAWERQADQVYRGFVTAPSLAAQIGRENYSVERQTIAAYIYRLNKAFRLAVARQSGYRGGQIPSLVETRRMLGARLGLDLRIVVPAE